MRRALDVLLVLAMLAVFISTANPSPAYADDTASLSSVATFSVDGPSSLLAPSSEPAQWWGGWGWGGWPWWAGMPLWQISAMTGYTWPWWSGFGWGGFGPWAGWGGMPSWGGMSGWGGPAMPSMGGSTATQIPMQ